MHSSCEERKIHSEVKDYWSSKSRPKLRPDLRGAVQVPDHALPVQDNVPVKPELQAQLGAPAALAGQATTAR